MLTLQESKSSSNYPLCDGNMERRPRIVNKKHEKKRQNAVGQLPSRLLLSHVVSLTLFPITIITQHASSNPHSPPMPIDKIQEPPHQSKGGISKAAILTDRAQRLLVLRARSSDGGICIIRGGAGSVLSSRFRFRVRFFVRARPSRGAIAVAVGCHPAGDPIPVGRSSAATAPTEEAAAAVASEAGDSSLGLGGLCGFGFGFAEGALLDDELRVVQQVVGAAAAASYEGPALLLVFGVVR